jgi:hypothetical protein
MRPRAIRRALTTATLALPLLGVVAWSQGLSFTVKTTLEADDNKGLDITDPQSTTSVDTTFGFGFARETTLDSLVLNGQGVFRFGNLPAGSATGFQDPSLSLAYRRDGATSRLALNTSYRRADLDFIDPLTLDTETGASSIRGGGFLTTLGADVTLETGVDRPFGFTLTATAQDRDYTEVTDVDLFDTRRVGASVSMRAALSPLSQARLSFGTDHYTADNPAQTDRTTRNVSLGLNQALSPVLTLDASVGFSRIDTDELFLGTVFSTREEGATGSVGLSRELVNGTLSGSLAVERDSSGVRNTLRFARQMELPRGTLAAQIGTTWRDGGDSQLVGLLSYDEALPRGALKLSLERAVTTNADDEDQLATRLGLSYQADINAVSGFGVSLDLRRAEDGGAGTLETVDRKTLRVTYTRELTEDWDMIGGYQYRSLDNDDGQAESNSVFFTLSRSFDFGQ